MMRGFVERGRIFDKDKGFFEKKNLEAIHSGPRVDFKII